MQLLFSRPVLCQRWSVRKYCLVFFLFVFLLHRAGNKESPICLAAGELNESFYGLSNLGE